MINSGNMVDCPQRKLRKVFIIKEIVPDFNAKLLKIQGIIV